MYDDNLSFYRDILVTFLKEIIKTKEAMKVTFTATDKEDYRILVHGLKGSGGSVGARHLVELATESNELIKTGRWEEAVKYHEPLIAELERLIGLIPERLEEKGEYI